MVAVAERRLEDSGYRILRQVRCRFEAGTLTLSGRVPSFYMNAGRADVGHDAA